jgi:cytochrome c oxidase subunit III
VHETTKDAPLSGLWSGGVAPLGTSSKKLGMWLFIVSDTLTFSAILLAYSYLRLANPDWPRPFDFYPAIIKSTGMTLVLLASSLTMVLGVAAAHRNDRKATVKWLLATAACGATFVILHMTEWVALFHEGYTPWSNPEGVPLFGATFFGTTGLHMLHVSIGVLYLLFIATGISRNKFTADDVEVSGLYWHFVDLVWMFVFPMIYLMSIKPR